MLLTYVDDVLFTAEFPKDAEVLKDCLKSRVPIKDTGFISPNTSSGGTLVFIGREIVRLPEEKTLFVKIPSDYLDDVFVIWFESCSSLRGYANFSSFRESRWGPVVK